LSTFFATYGHILILVAIALAAFAAFAVVFLLRDVHRLKQPFGNMAKLYEEKGGEYALEGLFKGVNENRTFLQAHAQELKAVGRRLDNTYASVGLVKYNAFEDIGGMQSYSLCLLTKERNGFILTNLVGRNSARGYALDIREGNPSRDLSDEEKEALANALQNLSG